MGASFTPGPWAVFRDHPDAETRESMATIDSMSRAEYSGGEIATVYVAPVGSEGDANARLIASAPSLFEAVRTLLDCFVEDPLSWMNNQSEAIEKARDAVAKATGGKS
jgi:hypothetical protein